MPPSREELEARLASRMRMANLYCRARSLQLEVASTSDRRGIRVRVTGLIPREDRPRQTEILEELYAYEGEMFDFLEASAALFDGIFGDGRRPRAPRLSPW